jgi:hypothetical protein
MVIRQREHERKSDAIFCSSSAVSVNETFGDV